jgi:hypothetical protein
LDAAVVGMSEWVRRMQAPDGLSQLRALYAQRTANYQGYVDGFLRTSWEQALADWWHQRTQE